MAKHCENCGTALFRGQTVCPNCGHTQGTYIPPKSNINQNNSSGRQCFVATVAFGNPNCDELNILRDFRDSNLSKSYLGRRFIFWYYLHGEKLAKWIENKPIIKNFTRSLLKAFTLLLKNRD